MQNGNEMKLYQSFYSIPISLPANMFFDIGVGEKNMFCMSQKSRKLCSFSLCPILPHLASHLKLQVSLGGSDDATYIPLPPHCGSDDASYIPLPPHCVSDDATYIPLPPHFGQDDASYIPLPPHCGSDDATYIPLPPLGGSDDATYIPLPPHCGSDDASYTDWCLIHL